MSADAVLVALWPAGDPGGDAASGRLAPTLGATVTGVDAHVH